MRSRQRIGVTQTQRLALNTSLQASIRLLRADAAGLTRYLEEQAAENPHLRLEPPPGPGLQDWLPRWGDVLRQGGSAAEAISAAPEAAPSLIAHVLQAVGAMGLTAAEHRIALALAEALEPSGWLGRSVPQVAQELRAAPAQVEAVLKRLQRIEPAGLFARSLAECLRLQAIEAEVLDAPMAVLLDHLDLLASGDLGRLARLCGVSEAGVMQRFRSIRAMNPKPGADFAPLAAAAVREPDLIVTAAKGGGWAVALNRSALPSLRVEPGPGGSAAALTAARALHRMVEARNATLLAVAREILDRQRAALQEGPVALLPLTMGEIAELLDLHESTISRVVAGTSLDTPRGTWWLRQMFSPALGDPETGPVVSAAALRHRLARIIATEQAAQPFSDADLVVLLQRETGLTIARRTVAKYRELQGIPPAHRRRRRAVLPRTDRKGRSQG